MADGDQGELLLTYAELATRLGVSADGARTRARRSGWPTIMGNDNRKRVRVHTSELPDHPRAKPEQTGNATALLDEIRRAYGEQSVALTARAAKAEQEADRWRTQAEHDRGEAVRDRAMVESLRDQLAREQRRAEDLAAELREARRPWLVRVLAVIRSG